MGTLITTSIMITLLLTSSLLLLTATEAQQFDQSLYLVVYGVASPPAVTNTARPVVPPAYHQAYPGLPLYGAPPPADSAVGAERKKRKAANQKIPRYHQEYQDLAQITATAGVSGVGVPYIISQLHTINSFADNPLTTQELINVYNLSLCTMVQPNTC